MTAAAHANPRLAALMAEVQGAPPVIAAVAADPKWAIELAAIERGLSAVDAQASDDPLMLETLDLILAMIARKDISMKQRLLKLEEIFRRVRDAGRIIH